MSYDFKPPSTTEATASAEAQALRDARQTGVSERFQEYRLASATNGQPGQTAVPDAFRGAEGQDIQLMSSSTNGATGGDNGWHMTGPGRWVRNIELPQNWGSMSDAQRQQYWQQIAEQARDQFSLVDSRGGIKRGWHTDAWSGEQFWMGYAGEKPDEPPPPRQRS